MSVFLTFIQLITWIANNKEALRELILEIEKLIPDSPGSTKASAVRSAIGAAMGIEAQIEPAWPMVEPIFNMFVGTVKRPAQ